LASAGTPCARWGAVDIHESVLGRRHIDKPIRPDVEQYLCTDRAGENLTRHAGYPYRPSRLIRRVANQRDALRDATDMSAGETGFGRATGIVKKKVLPWPTSLSTQILPPCASTIPFTMKRPRPVPSSA